MKKMLFVSAIFGSGMIINGVVNAEIAATLPGSACVAEGGAANKGIIGSQGEYSWTDTTQSKRVHCPVMSSSIYQYQRSGNGKSPKLVFNIHNSTSGTLTCTIKSLRLGRGGAGFQSGGSTVSSKKTGYGAARLRVTGRKATQQTVGYISYCNLPAAKGSYRGAASVIYNVEYYY